MTECERGTQRKSERLIEHFASIALFSNCFRFGTVLSSIHARLCHAILRVLVLCCKHFERSQALNLNLVHRAVRIRSVVPSFIDFCWHLDDLRLTMPSSA